MLRYARSSLSPSSLMDLLDNFIRRWQSEEGRVLETFGSLNDRLALKGIFRVLFFEPVDLYFYCRSLQVGRLGDLGKIPYDLTASLAPPQPVVPRSAAPASPALPSLRKSLRLTALVALGNCSSFHLRSPQET